MLGLEKEILNMFEYKKIPLLGLVWPLYMHYVITYYFIRFGSISGVNFRLHIMVISHRTDRIHCSTVNICENSEIILMH